jgi:hypothetical protein
VISDFVRRIAAAVGIFLEALGVAEDPFSVSAALS